MFKGVNHIGVGVTDMDSALQFYGDCLDFKEKLFDYTGLLTGMEKVTNKPKTKARVIMLKNNNQGAMGLGMIKLVQVLHPDIPGPIPDGTYWGEIGVSEICLSAHGVQEKFYELVIERGCKALMPPITCPLPPYGTIVDLAYVADPDGAKIELIDWKEMCPGLRTEPAVEGVNHVAFGVSDMKKSLEFYRNLGFTELTFEFDGYFDAFALWFPKVPKMRIAMLANYYGAAVELVEQTPPSDDLSGDWGHLGTMEFAIEVNNIEKACEDLKKRDVEFHSPPQTIETSSGQWKYAYLVDPDNLYVSLMEARF